MNATIEKLVSLLFEDIEETDEVRAIREEVLANAQERYEDMIESGLTEDEAVHEVVESLRGMEEMLGDYPHKKPEDEEPSIREWAYDPADSPIRGICLKQMKNADVRVQASPDHLIRVSMSDPKCQFAAEIHEGLITVVRTDNRKSNVKAHMELEMDDVGDLFNSLGDLLRRVTSRLVSTANELGGICLTLGIPRGLEPALRVETVSGDVSVESVSLAQLNVSTVSGDVVIAAVQTGQAHVNTISGDVDWSGETEELRFKTISGDVEAAVTGRPESVLGNTVSGDISLALPFGVDAAIHCRTTSGDIENRRASNPAGSVRVEVSTVSGDITIQ